MTLMLLCFNGYKLYEPVVVGALTRDGLFCFPIPGNYHIENVMELDYQLIAFVE